MFRNIVLYLRITTKKIEFLEKSGNVSYYTSKLIDSAHHINNRTVKRLYVILESFSCHREIRRSRFVIQSRALTILLSHEVTAVQPLHKYKSG